MIEQLTLFSKPRDQEPEPDKSPANPYDNTWWRPRSFFRYNENGRPSGWVRITRDYIAHISWDNFKHRLAAGYYRDDENRYSHYAWITAEDLNMYFEPIAAPEWLNNDD